MILPKDENRVRNCYCQQGCKRDVYDAETETRRSKQRLETFDRDVQAVTSH